MSPGCTPDVILTCPPTKFRLSASVTMAAGEIVTGGPFSVWDAVAAPVRLAGSFERQDVAGSLRELRALGDQRERRIVDLRRN